MFRGLRGQQQRSLRAALQGFTGRRFVCKLHDALPGGSAAVICHDNGSFHRPELRKRLEVESNSRIIYPENGGRHARHGGGDSKHGPTSPVPAAHW